MKRPKFPVSKHRKWNISTMHNTNRNYYAAKYGSHNQDQNSDHYGNVNMNESSGFAARTSGRTRHARPASNICSRGATKPNYQARKANIALSHDFYQTTRDCNL